MRKRFLERRVSHSFANPAPKRYKYPAYFFSVAQHPLSRLQSFSERGPRYCPPRDPVGLRCVCHNFCPVLSKTCTAAYSAADVPVNLALGRFLLRRFDNFYLCNQWIVYNKVIQDGVRSFGSWLFKWPIPEMKQLDLIKGRVAEALVESIFKRAEYKMTRFGRESDLRGMLKEGRDESYSPDFLAMKEVADQENSRGIYQTHMIEVKYRANLIGYLAQERKEAGNSVLVGAKEKWPNLCLVFVTDNPGENRSCFQALDMSDFEPGRFLRTVNLCEIKRLDLYFHNVQQHEELARKLFGLLGEMAANRKRHKRRVS